MDGVSRWSAASSSSVATGCLLCWFVVVVLLLFAHRVNGTLASTELSLWTALAPQDDNRVYAAGMAHVVNGERGEVIIRGPVRDCAIAAKTVTDGARRNADSERHCQRRQWYRTCAAATAATRRINTENDHHHHRRRCCHTNNTNNNHIALFYFFFAQKYWQESNSAADGATGGRSLGNGLLLLLYFKICNIFIFSGFLIITGSPPSVQRKSVKWWIPRKHKKLPTRPTTTSTTKNQPQTTVHEQAAKTQKQTAIEKAPFNCNY